MTTSEAPAHFFQHFFDNIRVRADQPLLYEKQGATFQTVTQRETASRIADFSRSLSAAAIGTGDRVALHAAANPSLLISEWAALTSRAVAVIIPRSFSAEELIETLVESKSRLTIVDRLATAYHVANAGLPDLRHIVCLEGGAHAQVPIWSWSDFIDSGRREPDRTTTLLRSITDKDTALLFYYKDANNMRQATRYTHGLLLDHISRIETMLGAATLRKGELVLTATTWEHAIGHITSCYVPVLKDAIIEITHGVPDVGFFESHPYVTVGDSAFFDGVRQTILKIMRQSGQVESMMLKKALSLSKLSYESKNLGSVARIQKAMLQATIVKKIQKILGGRLRLFIGTDDKAEYDMQLFFHTFGIELIELPPEVFR